MNTVFKALSDPTRRRVLQLLRAGPKAAGALSDQFAVSKPTMSAHFAVLREAGVVATRREAQTIWYRIADPRIEALLGHLQQLYCPPPPAVRKKK